MILICGIPSEPPLRAAIAAAERARVPHAVFNQREAAACDIALDVDGATPSGVLALPGGDIALEDVEGVYTRVMDSDLLPENRGRANSERRERARMLHAALDEWLEAAACRVVNRTSAMASNVSKPYQAQLIRRVGFETPPTLITNVPDEARAFARANGSKVIFKSISSVRSIVHRLDHERLEGLDRVSHLPTQFQQLVEGTDVRVHVIGSSAFATELATDAVDYRYAGRDNLDVDVRPTTLPADVEERCVELARLLEIPFCGIDLLRTRSGDFVCLEVNPSPAYNYYEDSTGQEISATLIGYLAGDVR